MGKVLAECILDLALQVNTDWFQYGLFHFDKSPSAAHKERQRWVLLIVLYLAWHTFLQPYMTFLELMPLLLWLRTEGFQHRHVTFVFSVVHDIKHWRQDNYTSERAQTHCPHSSNVASSVSIDVGLLQLCHRENEWHNFKSKVNKCIFIHLKLRIQHGYFLLKHAGHFPRPPRWIWIKHAS